ncbi:MAG: sigma-54 dependent transcriptional regulator [Acidobacteriota bacterium]
MSVSNTEQPNMLPEDQDSRKPFKLLIIDDEPDVLDSLSLTFRKDYQVLCAQGGEEGLRLMSEHDIALVIADQRMPGLSGIQFFAKIKQTHPRTMRIMLTGYTDVRDTIDAINNGSVYRYITKPWDNQELRLTVKQALDYYSLSCELEDKVVALSVLNRELEAAQALLREENEALRRETAEKYRKPGIIGNSPQLRLVLEMMQQVAPTNAPVLIEGESGTGKELIAKSLHYSSLRSTQPLVSLNCAAIPESLLESELFGYDKGAFTGALKRRLGRFEAAHNGTLFLDEIGDMSLVIQSKLLRVLQDGEVQRLGSDQHLKVDVRIVAATHRNLHQWVKEGKFRQDLYYRLNVINLAIPPLRDRVEDIPLLADHFVRKFGRESSKFVRGLDAAALQLLLSYPYPGNVRELENIIHRAVILVKGDWITPAELPAHLREAPAPGTVEAIPRTNEELKTAKAAARQRAGDQVEKLFLSNLLARNNGRVTQAAAEAGINRSLLQQMITRHGLDSKSFK